jgi:hypothetical protein
MRAILSIAGGDGVEEAAGSSGVVERGRENLKFCGESEALGA